MSGTAHSCGRRFVTDVGRSVQAHVAATRGKLWPVHPDHGRGPHAAATEGRAGWRCLVTWIPDPDPTPDPPTRDHLLRDFIVTRHDCGQGRPGAYRGRPAVRLVPVQHSEGQRHGDRSGRRQRHRHGQESVGLAFRRGQDESPRDVETADQGCLPVGLPSVHSRPLQALEREEEAGCNQGRKMETRSRVSRSAFPNETGHPDPRREEGAALFDLVDVPHA